jgi:hypothetical protein
VSRVVPDSDRGLWVEEPAHDLQGLNPLALRVFLLSCRIGLAGGTLWAGMICQVPRQRLQVVVVSPPSASIPISHSSLMAGVMAVSRSLPDRASSAPNRSGGSERIHGRHAIRSPSGHRCGGTGRRYTTALLVCHVEIAALRVPFSPPKHRVVDLFSRGLEDRIRFGHRNPPR